MSENNVLVLDDEANFTGLVTNYAKIKSIPAQSASNADEAIELLNKKTFYVILIDLHLGPGQQSGLDFAEYVRANYPQVILCIVTGNELNKNEMVRARNIGVDVIKKDHLDGNRLYSLMLGQWTSMPSQADTERKGIVGELKIRCDILEAQNVELKSVIDLLIEDLVDELKNLPNQKAEKIIAGTKRISTEELLDDLKKKNSRGIKIVRWYHSYLQLLRGKHVT
ncbi:MAG: response regulator [candidate division Zixibacteria bacterium]